MKNGFKIMDSDLHTMEPDGFWERDLDEPFKNQPIITIGDLALGEMSKRPLEAAVGKSLHRRAMSASSARRAPRCFTARRTQIRGVSVAGFVGRGRPVSGAG